VKVARSGIDAERIGPVIAIGLMPLALMRGIAEVGLEKLMSRLPFCTSVIAGTSPLYGTCVSLRFASRARIWPARCPQEAMPQEPKVTSRGCAFTQSTRPFRSL